MRILGAQPRQFALIVLAIAVVAGLVRIGIVPSVPAGGPTLQQVWFERAYALDSDEVVRLCLPPYPPTRRKYASWIKATDPPERSGEMLFHAERLQHFWMASTSTGTLRSAVAHVGGLTPVECDVPQDLGELTVIGDWVVRNEDSRDRKMAALASILRQHLRRPIVIEKRSLPRPALVMTGRYAFHSLARGREPTEIQLFSDTLDPKEGAGGGTGIFADLKRRIEEVTSRRVVDQSSDHPVQIKWSNNHSLHECNTDPAKLAMLLKNLSDQTSLHFEQAVRDVDVYCVREENSPGTRP